MRHLTFIRGGALAAAAALALTAGPVVAAEPAVVDVQKISAYSVELSNRSSNYVPVGITLDPGADTSSIDHISLTLLVDGMDERTFDVREDMGVMEVVLPDDIGLGKARFVRSTIHYTAASGLPPTEDTTPSNAFYVRRATTYWPLYYKKSGTKMTFYARGIGIYKPSTHSFESLRTVKLQYRKGGTWRTKKTLTLDAKGNGRYAYRSKTVYQYRFYSAITTTSGGLAVSLPRKR